MYASTLAMNAAGFFSRGILRWDAVPVLLSEFTQFRHMRTKSAPKVDAIIGWGAKPTSEIARAYANHHQLPYIAIEDGFLRSYGLGVEKNQPQSLVIDHTGIYYDAYRPSDLENMLRDVDFSTEDLNRAKNAITRIRHNHLSKYNSAPDHLPDEVKSYSSCVLVVDQTRDDASVTLGMGSPSRFEAMLNYALERHPKSQILIKVHPDVAKGHRRGYLSEISLPSRCTRLDEALNPWPLLEQVEAVHVMTSQTGFEALMAGCHVICHGMPFYAGWGLTEDQLSCDRRNRKRTLEEVFAAAYLRYSRYYNPYTRKQCELEQTIDLLADQKRQSERTTGAWAIYGMSGWKRGFIHHFLGPKARVRYINAPSRWHKASDQQTLIPDENLLVWGHKDYSSLLEQNPRLLQHHKITRMEDGFIRSVGLGADLIRPCSLVLDSKGIYYDASAPSDLEYLLQNTHFSDDMLARADRLRHLLIKLKLSKYNVGNSASFTLPRDKKIILVPGQVESDASIRHGTQQVCTNAALLEQVRKRNPGAFIVYKEHPDVTSGGRLGALSAEEHELYDMDATGIDIIELLDTVDCVHTMSSLTGFEALLRHIPVHTWGSPFYAGWGLTTEELPLNESAAKRRTRPLSLNELVAGTLLLYPNYVEPNSGDLCNPETIIELISRHATGRSTPSPRVRFWRLYRRIFDRNTIR
ncbi:capsular polysaccharide biosynthesis protein [Cernens ardua]|uniref:capsular polysaccharide biosynthesis protein n=1 Tax=Cernens ardua TaxID=3402176 RepID=UPI003F97911C